ncbi:uncharacterized protein L969DRAFT_94383 [Mixia osmundae IAM 14324]|uniref:Uncharacterized protein n=1 Tax=Mixia osmundae (strain CBS 9802 / IAM 14324 / JCM 22182 / KY 12970) TaxID=764103 RepID=G7E3B4_MIXOS|nr:uncharacterized protein L969DRAFT_94383 [Mixia osmundae IAM 14324]KEI39311.1 hypothetical protein L969DRAFT_94383 [Mixia osmundae IAM 14324]GAA97324.1 hypothetical protein E5Q_04002 [Mixia osmundae IAM 14324]
MPKVRAQITELRFVNGCTTNTVSRAYDYPVRLMPIFAGRLGCSGGGCNDSAAIGACRACKGERYLATTLIQTALGPRVSSGQL